MMNCIDKRNIFKKERLTEFSVQILSKICDTDGPLSVNSAIFV